MANGYIRQSASQIVNGEIITAPPLTAEFNAIVDAFDGVQGHAHDGSVGNAPPINLLTSVVEILKNENGGVGWAHNTDAEVNPTISDDVGLDYGPGSVWVNTSDSRLFLCVDGTSGAAIWMEVLGVRSNQILPHTHNVVDLGQANRRFKNLFLQGTLTAQNIAATTLTGNMNAGSNKITNLGTPTNNADAAHKQYVDQQIANLVNSAPGVLDTLSEIATAIGNDPNFATTMANQLNTKMDKSGGSFTGNVSMGGNTITNLAAPVGSLQATNKAYVDSILGSSEDAATSAQQAANSASAAAGSASTANTHAGTANTHRVAAQGFRNQAENFALDAQGSANAANITYNNTITQRDLARDWATKTTGPVSGGEFSAKHYAGKAEDWSDGDIDVPVEPGRYSARHWAFKAQESSGFAPNPALQPNHYIRTSTSGYDFVNAASIVNEAYGQGSVTLRTGSSIRQPGSGNIDYHFRDSGNTSRAVISAGSGNSRLLIRRNSTSGTAQGEIQILGDGANDLRFNAWTVWHSGNGGSGSGLDADRLDGQHGSYYQNASNLNSGTLPNARLSGTYSGFGINAVGQTFNLGSVGIHQGLSFGTATVNDPHDISRHISLYGDGSTGYGFSVSSSNLNYQANNNHTFYSGTTMVARFHSNGRTYAYGGLTVTGTISGDGAPITNLNASNISAGTLNANRLPNLNASILTAGTLALGRIPNLPAGQVTTGTFAVARIPNLPASHINSGSFAAARIPNLPASKITSGTFSSARIPNLSASILTAGTLPNGRLSGNYSFGSLTLSGELTSGGRVSGDSISATGGGSIIGNGSQLNLGPSGTSSGNVYIRPQGTGNTSNQTRFHPNGNIYVGGGGVEANGIRLGFDGQGTITNSVNSSWSAFSGNTDYNVAANVLCYGPNSNSGVGRLRYNGTTMLQWNSSTVTVNNGASGLHTVNTVESASGTNHTDFTIGTVVYVNSTSKRSRRNAMSPRLDSSNDSHYREGGSGSSLSGTWRQCGERGGASDQNLAQRVA